MQVTLTGEQTTLSEGYHGEPEQHLIDDYGVRGWENTKYAIVEINPREWYKKALKGDVTIQQAYQRFALPWQKKLVAHYRSQAAHYARTTLLIIDSDTELIEDGYHRLVAFALSGITTAKAIDTAQELES